MTVIRYRKTQLFTFVCSTGLIHNMRNLSVFKGDNCLSGYGITFIIFLFFVGQGLSLEAQSSGVDNYTYKGLNDYVTFLDSFLNVNAQHIDRKFRKEYNEIIREKNTGLVKELSENNFLFDSTVHPYLSSIFYSIVQKNGLTKYPFHFFVSRSSQINAYSYDDCTIVCNAGLLNIMENESQITMVFCHEIAHYLLGHSFKTVTTQLEKYTSPEFNAQVKAIKKEKYNTKSKLEEILLEDIFNRRKHNRAQETSADSLGMLLFLKTGYNSGSVARLFDLLNESNDINSTVSIRFFLANTGIVVDEKWFDAGRKITFGKAVSKETADSMRTHPDCVKRKKYATDFLHGRTVGGYDFKIGDNQILNTAKKSALFEQAGYWKEKKNMSMYLYLLIQNSAKYDNSKFIATEIFNTLLLLTTAQKNHTLYSITDKPYTAGEEKDQYAKLLQLIDRVDLRQLSDITIAYFEHNKQLIILNTDTSLNFEKLKQF